MLQMLVLFSSEISEHVFRPCGVRSSEAKGKKEKHNPARRARGY